MLRNSFSAKVLLFGEYTILNGSRALALPLHRYSGSWSFSSHDQVRKEESRLSLEKFIQSEAAKKLNLKKLQDDFAQGLWFDSTIPQGFGLGSSGAVVAALYQEYGEPKFKLDEDREILAKLESFFHGTSSGLDPLVSHINTPLHIQSVEKVDCLYHALNLEGFFLVNTFKPRKTGPLVTLYKEKQKDPNFSRGCSDILMKEVNFAIDCVLTKSSQNLTHHLWHISKFQWDFFNEMIPEKEKKIWELGLETGDYVLKLCGAGGGGFLLGHSDKLSIIELKEKFTEHEVFKLSES